jgi:putative spermidine/putrescine transport system substrate-binding protein
MKRSRILAATAAAALLAGPLAACGPPSKNSDSTKTTTGVKYSEAKSLSDFGGMSALVKAAKKEGTLNVIALPPAWANYGNIIQAFKDKYGLKINSALPDGASQDEINAANQQKGKSTAPDVFDLGQSVALANKAMFAPYTVATFGDIPPQYKDPNGTWVNDYGGYMAIGYDSAKVPAITSVDDLMKPAFKGKVALNGDPTQAGAAFSGVMMVALAKGGSADNIAPGVDFFKSLKKAGNFLPVDPSAATIEAKQTPVVIDWDYLNAAETAKLPSWKVVVPPGSPLAGYYFQTINKDAPHPAAARLWEEFLYSDAGQNLYAQGGVRPVRADNMTAAGTLDKTVAAQLPIIDGPVTVPSPDQTAKATKYLADNWAKAIG